MCPGLHPAFPWSCSGTTRVGSDWPCCVALGQSWSLSVPPMPHRWSIYQHLLYPAPGQAWGQGPHRFPAIRHAQSRGGSRGSQAGLLMAPLCVSCSTCAGPPRGCPPETARGQARCHGLAQHWTSHRVTERAPPRPLASSAEASPRPLPRGPKHQGWGHVTSEGPGSHASFPCPPRWLG